MRLRTISAEPAAKREPQTKFAALCRSFRRAGSDERKRLLSPPNSEGVPEERFRVDDDCLMHVPSKSLVIAIFLRESVEVAFPWLSAPSAAQWQPAAVQVQQRKSWKKQTVAFL